MLTLMDTVMVTVIVPVEVAGMRTVMSICTEMDTDIGTCTVVGTGKCTDMLVVTL